MSAPSDQALVLEGVSVRYGGLLALDGVTLALEPGERVGVVGPNGAGKTTLLDVVSGLARPAAGAVRLGARRLTGLPPERVARAGIGRTFQFPRLVAHLTVEENARAGRRLDVGPWLERAGLGARRTALAATLTPGEARRLELARALAARPRILLLDEPSGGLNPAETESLYRFLVEALEPGCTALVVEHKLGALERFCPRAVVLQQGRVVFDGSPAAMREDPRVLEAYLGRQRPP